MRAFEFKLYENAAVPANEILAKAKKSPVALDKAIKGVEAINDAARKYIELIKEKDTKPSQPKTNAVKPIIPPSQQTQAPPVESLDEAQENSIEELRQELNDNADLTKYLKFQASKGDKTAAKLVKEMEAKAKELNKLLDEAVKYAGDVRQQEIEDWFSGLDDDIMALAAKASSNATIQKEITNRFKGSFTTEVLVKKNISKDDLTTFLKDAEEGKVIDMESLVNVDSGNINRFVEDKYKPVFDTIKADVFPYSPPGTGHNMGPGEVALTMFGNPIVKGEVGDLNVGGTLYELKGAKSKSPAGKSAKSGGRMNGKDVSKPTSGRSTIIKWITKNISKEALAPYQEGTKLKELNWNGKGIENLNKLFAENIQDSGKRAEKMKDFMLTLWQAMIQNHGSIDDFDSRVEGMVDSNGQLTQNPIQTIVELLYESYADSDGEKDEEGNKKPFNIMVFNAQSLEYKIVRSTEGFAKQGIKVIGGIDWNDANASASPQLYID
jgi:hypothetical protein